MTAQAITAPRVRGLGPGEVGRLGPLLNATFAGYRDATHFSPPVLAFLDGWAWAAEPLSVVVEHRGDPIGVGLACRREATWRDVSVTSVHLGPIGVVPTFRRRGLGGVMLAALEERARSIGADTLSLTTEVIYGAWRLYARKGFQIIETYRPLVRPLFPGLPHTLGPDPEDLQAVEVDAAIFQATWTPIPAREGAVVERYLGEVPPDPDLRPRWFLAGESGVATLRWPVLSRVPGGRQEVWATQILRCSGGGAELAVAVAAAPRAAREDEAVCIYALPSSATFLAGFSARGAPLVHRMVRPLTSLGEEIARDAQAWDEVCPAP